MRIELIKENLTFTGEDSPMSTLMLSIMGAFAEFERALIRERQREGILLAFRLVAIISFDTTLSLKQTSRLFFCYHFLPHC
ncbi:recombinase family protein [Paenibacillus farraposensis]